MEKNKKVAVLFSGGLDSTYLIWDNLKKGNTVIPVYFTIINNGDKPQLERNRIDLLYKKFYETYGGLIKEPENVISLEVTKLGSNLHFHQVPVWILGLQFCQISYLDEIQIGYVMNDDIVSYINDIKKIYNSYKGILDKQIKLKFPLLKINKEYIFKELPKKYRDLTVTCENPKIIGDDNATILNYEPCGNCPACIKKIHVCNEFDNIPENYKKLEILNSIDYLSKFGSILNSKQENDRHTITFEFEEDLSTNLKNKIDSISDILKTSSLKHKQLKINFE
jgi:7-cyano-7-deazaguanine synthase in queuosine biosynthesis